MIGKAIHDAAREIIYLCGIGGYGPELSDDHPIVKKSILEIRKVVDKSNEELKADIEALTKEDERWLARVAELEQVSEHLQAIVDRLPKTRDGVSVLPPDEVWSVESDGIFKRHVQYDGGREYAAWAGFRTFPIDVNLCYSTEELAKEYWEHNETNGKG